jgi:hypothetical protein
MSLGQRLLLFRPLGLPILFWSLRMMLWKPAKQALSDIRLGLINPDSVKLKMLKCGQLSQLPMHAYAYLDHHGTVELFRTFHIEQ